MVALETLTKGTEGSFSARAAACIEIAISKAIAESI